MNDSTIKHMNSKTIHIPEDCVGAVQTALRIRRIYLQSYREQCQQEGQTKAAESITTDIANLTMISDRIEETPFS